MKEKKLCNFFKILLVVFLCFTFMAPVFAETIDQKRDELNDVKREIDAIEKELKEHKSQAEQLSEEIAKTEEELKRTEDELKKINNNINAAEKKIQLKEEEIRLKIEQIQVKEDEIAEVEEWLAQQDELVKIRIRAIYESGAISYLEVLLSSSGFNDFLTRFNYLKSILDSDVALFNQINEEREKLETQRDELEVQRGELEVQRDEMESQRQALLALRRSQVDTQQQIDRQSRAMSQLRSEVEQVIDARERAIRDLEAESKQIQSLINKLLEEQRSKSGAAPTGKLAWPVPGYNRITSYFGNRIHPITGQASFHSGIDIGAPTGVPIVAAESGTVILARYYGGYGNCVIIDHGGGMVTVYAHAHTLNSSVGQNVSRGQRIAAVGSTGFSTGPHLHFEVRINGGTVNPLSYY